jgi:hypothetical protein
VCECNGAGQKAPIRETNLGFAISDPHLDEGVHPRTLREAVLSLRPDLPVVVMTGVSDLRLASTQNIAGHTP